MTSHYMSQAISQMMNSAAINGDTHEALHYNDPNICRSFLEGFCIKELFINTKLTSGSCEKVHSLKLREEYESDKAKGVDVSAIERDVEEEIAPLISACDRKITVAQKRMANDSSILKTQKLNKKIEELDKQIQEKSTESEAMGEEGKVDVAMQLMAEADELKLKKDAVNEELQALAALDAINGAQRARVCEICGAQLSQSDDDKRIADHFTGKTHLGFSKLRDLMTDLRGRFEKRMKSQPYQPARPGFEYPPNAVPAGYYGHQPYMMPYGAPPPHALPYKEFDPSYSYHPSYPYQAYPGYYGSSYRGRSRSCSRSRDYYSRSYDRDHRRRRRRTRSPSRDTSRSSRDDRRASRSSRDSRKSKKRSRASSRSCSPSRKDSSRSPSPGDRESQGSSKKPTKRMRQESSVDLGSKANVDDSSVLNLDLPNANADTCDPHSHSGDSKIESSRNNSLTQNVDGPVSNESDETVDKKFSESKAEEQESTSDSKEDKEGKEPAKRKRERTTSSACRSRNSSVTSEKSDGSYNRRKRGNGKSKGHSSHRSRKHTSGYSDHSDDDYYSRSRNHSSSRSGRGSKHRSYGDRYASGRSRGYSRSRSRSRSRSTSRCRSRSRSNEFDSRRSLRNRGRGSDRWGSRDRNFSRDGASWGLRSPGYDEHLSSSTSSLVNSASKIVPLFSFDGRDKDLPKTTIGGVAALPVSAGTQPQSLNTSPTEERGSSVKTASSAHLAFSFTQSSAAPVSASDDKEEGEI